MTREEAVRQWLKTEITAFTSWAYLPGAQPRDLSASQFPSYTLEFGKTRYTKHDPFGIALAGEQDITLRFYYDTNLFSAEPVNPLRSNYLESLEQLILHGLTPPAVQPGDQYRVDTLTLRAASAPILENLRTRFSLEMSLSYGFSFI